MTTDPAIYLVADNCFAIKRWIQPLEWMTVARELGLSFVQASTDNEFDALYGDPSYLEDWVTSVRRATDETGVQVRSVYTGYQTYRTVGMAHPDVRVRRRIIDGWLKPTIDACAELQAELGFHLFAYPEEAMQDARRYEQTTEWILDGLGEAATYAHSAGVRISIEQMYSPHQPPWTIHQAREFLAAIYERAQAPCYLTIDTGHQVGQARYRRPTREQVNRAVADRDVSDAWWGSEATHRMVEGGERGVTSGSDEITAALERDRRFFADEQDSDLYEWIRRLGRYSPIMHLQQTDGTGSHHAPFTVRTNPTGIVHPMKVLTALRESFSQGTEAGMPVPPDSVYLSFEIFSGTADTRREVLRRMRESIEYWRESIPRDGLSLSELVVDD
ncbi:MAG: TIM barrel protein [Candidatus Nanopelagicales bacterium]